MGRAQGQAIKEHMGSRFEALLGSRRGTGAGLDSRDAQPDFQRTLRNPGPMWEGVFNTGKRVRVRIIRPGDRIGAPSQTVHTANVRKFHSNGDGCLVEFLEDAPDTDKWPTGFPSSGRYYVGTLRTDSDRLIEDGFQFSTGPGALGLDGEEMRKLLTWLDEQLSS